LSFLFGIPITDFSIVNFAGQLAGQIDRLAVASGHENLDWFLLCNGHFQIFAIATWRGSGGNKSFAIRLPLKCPVK